MPPDTFTEKQREVLEILAGRRGDSKRHAVRIGDLQPLLELPPSLQADAAAGATPTKAEYDQLREDVRTLHRRLLAVAELLGARVNR